MTGLRRVTVDFNERFEHDWLIAGIRRLDWPVQVGEEVIVYEPYDIRARARVAKVDETTGLVYFEVDWDSVEAEGDLPTEPSSAHA